MKKSYITWFIIGLCAIIVFVVGVPIIINESYKANSGYVTLWTAADVLSYYGAIIASLGAAIGVFASLRYSHKQYREDKRRDVLPYFAINILGNNRIDPFLSALFSDDGKLEEEQENRTRDDLTYREFIFNECFFVFENGTIKYTRKLSEEQEDARKMGITIRGNGGTEIWKNNIIYIPIKAVNVGNGCAINTTITIQAIGNKNITVTSIPISIPVKEEMYAGLLFYGDEKLLGEYSYIMRYYDIHGNQYEHQKPIKMERRGKAYNVKVSENTSHALIARENTPQMLD